MSAIHLISAIREGLPQVRIAVCAGSTRFCSSLFETWSGSAGATVAFRAACALDASAPLASIAVSSPVSFRGMSSMWRSTLFARPRARPPSKENASRWPAHRGDINEVELPGSLDCEEFLVEGKLFGTFDSCAARWTRTASAAPRDASKWSLLDHRHEGRQACTGPHQHDAFCETVGPPGKR